MQARKTGVAWDTLVHTRQGFRLARELAPGEEVWSFDRPAKTWVLTTVRKVAVETVKAEMTQLRLAGAPLVLGVSQLVLADTGRWIEAGKLLAGDHVFSCSGALLVEENVFREQETAAVAEVETSGPHSYAVWPPGVLVHNRNPPLAAGQSHTLTVQATGAQLQLTLPPIDLEHLFQGLVDPAIPVLHGLHHVAGQPVIQQGTPIFVAGHVVLLPAPAGGRSPLVVNLRITPALSVTGFAPFAARVEARDPVTNAILAVKRNSTFFPANWTAAQVVQAVYEAACNYVVAHGMPPIGRGLRARTDAGVAMLLHVSANAAGSPGLIGSGYPHGPQPLVTAAQVPL